VRRQPRLFISSHVREGDSQRAVCQAVVGIQLDGFTEGRLGARPVPIEKEVHDPQGGLSFGKFGIGVDRMSGGVAGPRPHLKWTRIAVDRTRCVGVRQPRPRQRISRVDLSGACVYSTARRVVGGER